MDFRPPIPIYHAETLRILRKPTSGMGKQPNMMRQASDYLDQAIFPDLES
jgi:hypothetical protein